jgi:hypothetical protein
LGGAQIRKPGCGFFENRAIGGWTRTFTNPAADNFIESRVSALAASPSLKWKNSSGPKQE